MAEVLARAVPAGEESVRRAPDRRTALTPAAGPEEPRIVWSWELPSEEGADAYSGPAIVGGPVVAADGTAYVVSDGEQGGLWAVGPDGALRWRVPFGQVDWRRGERRLALDAVPRSPEGFFVDIAGRTGLQRRTGNDSGSMLRYLCLLYTSPSPRDRTRSRMPSSA